MKKLLQKNRRTSSSKKTLNTSSLRLAYGSVFAFLLLMSGGVFGQTTIASDGLNSTSTLFTLSGGAYYTGNSGSGDRPATSPFASEGTHSRGVSNSTATLTSSDINTSAYTGVSLTFRLAAFSISSTGNGLDGSDDVVVEVSPNGGTTYYSTISVSGNGNAQWAYSTGTGTASTAYDGNTTVVDFSPAGGGNRTTDGYSTVTITGLPTVSNLRVRITLKTNDTKERWVMDDFKVTGTVSGKTSTGTGDWNTSGTWTPSGVPSATDNVTILSGHVVTASGAVTRDSGSTTTVNTGGTLAVGATYTNNGTTTINGTFQLNSGGWATGNNFVYNGTTGTLNFDTTSIYDVNNSDVFWPTTGGPFNVNVLRSNAGGGSAGLRLNTANRTISGTLKVSGKELGSLAAVYLNTSSLTINGTAEINAFGYFSNAPIYGTSSKLIYNIGGTYARGAEWSANSGAGYPNEVELINNTTLDYPNTGGGAFSTALSIDKHLTIASGSSLYMGYGDSGNKSGNLTVKGNFTNNGNFGLGNASGGDLYVGGNWTKGAGSNFYPNSRAVFFNGTAAQTITGATTFDYLVLNNTAGVTLENAVVVNNNLTFTNGKLTLGTNDLTVSGAINNSSATKYVVTNSTGQLKRTVAGTSVLFPIGPTTALYNPISATNSGTSDVYGFRVATGVSGATDIESMVNNSWYVSEAVAGSGQLRVQPQWNLADEGSTFSATDNYIEFYAPAITKYAATVASRVASITAGGSTFTNAATGSTFFAVAKRSAPVISSALTASGVTGTAFTYTIAASNTPTSYNAAGLPTGLSVNTTTGVISGTPTVAGTSSITISATNAEGTDSKTLVITISAGPCFTKNAPDFTKVGYTTGGSADSGGSPTSTIRLASGGAAASISTTATGITAGDVIVKFRVQGYDSDETEITVTVNGVSQFIENLPLTYTEISATFTSVPANPVISFSTIAGKRVEIGNVKVFCFESCTPPSTSATALTVNNATVSSLDLNFTRGNGDGVMIVARAGATPATAPLSGTSYSVSDAVGGGTVVYKGIASGASTATTQTISSLLQNTQYQFSVYEYVSATNCYQVTALAGSGTTLYREINLKGNSVSIVNNDATPALTDHTDFSTAYVTGGTVVRTFTIENTGTAALTLSGSSPYVAISGTNASDFSVTAIPSASIGAASSTTFNITFDPSALGSRTATLTIANNDSDENPYIFAIKGEGICTPSANPVGTIGGTFSACATTNITYTGADAATSYWQTTATGTSTAEPVTTAKTVTMSGTYYVRNFASSCWSTASISQVITIATPPSISTQPASKIAVAGGTAPTFSVTATGTGLTYQWQVDTGSGWSNVSTGTGGTTSSYTTVTPVLNMNDNAYRVIITGGSCGSITSNAASLTVDYCDSAPSSNDNSGISNVVMGSANFPVGDVFYYNFTGSVPDLIQGASITSSITFATGYDYHNHIWIDFNDDGVFDNTNEKVWSGLAPATNPNTYNTTFILDAAAAIGTHKMRIGTADNGQATPNPCYNGTYGVTIDLFVNIISSCTPNHTITSYSPTSGPEGTVITVVGTGFSVGTTATLGIESAAVSYINATEIKIVVPSGTTTSGLVISDAADCTLLAGTFTVLETTITSCETTSEGGGSASDLIIFEVYDENGGSGGIISLFNNTGASVNLSGYTIERAGEYGVTYAVYSTLSGTLADNTVAVIAVSGSKCLYTATGNGSVPSGGFNENDGFRLIKDGTLIDDVKAPNYLGYYLKRKITDLSPNTTFDISEWTTTAVVEDECLPGVAVVPLLKLPPVIITQPLENAQACGVTDATFTVSATEGVVGGLGITYQWFMNVPGNSGWTAVSGTDFTGATTATLTVANASTYDGYQFYCEVRENTATCSTASEAVAIGGAIETIIYSGGTWIGGTPDDITKNVIIDAGSTYNTTSGAIIARKLTNNGTLTVDVTNPVTIEFELINNGTFSILDGGSLVQNCDVDNATNNANVGSITVTRITQPMNKYDYTYWGSPVAGNYLNALSPDTHVNRYYSYNPDATGTTPNWTAITGGNAPMAAGKGYIIRAPNNYPTATYTAYTGNFIGVPNNGTVSIAVSGAANPVEKYNLLGNPYPSAISANDFISENVGIGKPLAGTLYFWTHNSPFASTGYAYSAGDYAAWNGSGSVATNTGANTTAPDGNIAAGQGFFVQGMASGNAKFTNDMRVTGNNMQFFKSNPAETAAGVNASSTVEPIERSRVWLNLKGGVDGFSQTLVGYIENATNDYDTLFDGPSFGGNSVTFYSINNAKNLVIQGRALPFADTDEVPMGYKTTLTGNLTIGIDHVDGLFDNQIVYLKDNVLDVVHNLTDADYVFAAIPGTFNDRFVLRYLPAIDLANPTFDEQISNVTIRKNDATLRVNSPYEMIDEVRVYDIMGRLVFEQKDCNTNTFEASYIVSSDQTLIVKVKLNNGGVVTKKVL